MQFLQQVFDVARFGNEWDRPDQTANGDPGLLFGWQLHEVSNAHDALDMVQLPGKDGVSGQALFAEQLAKVFDRGIHLDGGNFRARRHHLAYDLVPEFDDRLYEFTLPFFEQAFLLTDFNKLLQVLLRAGGLRFLLRGLQQAAHGG